MKVYVERDNSCGWFWVFVLVDWLVQKSVECLICCWGDSCVLRITLVNQYHCDSCSRMLWLLAGKCVWCGNGWLSGYELKCFEHTPKIDQLYHAVGCRRERELDCRLGWWGLLLLMGNDDLMVGVDYWYRWCVVAVYTKWYWTWEVEFWWLWVMMMVVFKDGRHMMLIL